MENTEHYIQILHIVPLYITIIFQADKFKIFFLVGVSISNSQKLKEWIYREVEGYSRPEKHYKPIQDILKKSIILVSNVQNLPFHSHLPCCGYREDREEMKPPHLLPETLVLRSPDPTSSSYIPSRFDLFSLFFVFCSVFICLFSFNGANIKAQIHIVLKIETIF